MNNKMAVIDRKFRYKLSPVVLLLSFIRSNTYGLLPQATRPMLAPVKMLTPLF